MRVFLVLVVLAVGADAVMFNGFYTQSAWRLIVDFAQRVQQNTTTAR